MPARRAPAFLLAIVLAALVWSAVNPSDIGTWFMETVWAVAGVVVVIAMWRRFPLTTLSCCVLAAWAVVLAYGGHTSYAEAPFGNAVQDWLGLDRNPYDRLGHFMQGFAPAIAVREILWRRSSLQASRWLPVLVISCCLAISACWELLEWVGAIVVENGDPAFLGGQGDPWDTQWDLFLALVGSVLALALFSRLHDRQLVRIVVANGVSANRHRKAEPGDSSGRLGYRPTDDAWSDP